MIAILDRHKEPALPLLALLADFDGSSVAASVETAHKELIFLHFLPQPAHFYPSPNGTAQDIFKPLSNMLQMCSFNLWEGNTRCSMRYVAIHIDLKSVFAYVPSALTSRGCNAVALSSSACSFESASWKIIFSRARRQTRSFTTWRKGSGESKNWNNGPFKRQICRYTFVQVLFFFTPTRGINYNCHHQGATFLSAGALRCFWICAATFIFPFNDSSNDFAFFQTSMVNKNALVTLQFEYRLCWHNRPSSGTGWYYIMVQPSPSSADSASTRHKQSEMLLLFILLTGWVHSGKNLQHGQCEP